MIPDDLISDLCYRVVDDFINAPGELVEVELKRVLTLYDDLKAHRQERILLDILDAEQIPFALLAYVLVVVE